MKVVFTTNNAPFSKFLQWGLNEPVSHMAIVFDNKIVFHATFSGVHIEWYETFKRHYKVVYEVEIEGSLETEEKYYQKIISMYDGRGYDFMGIFYLVVRGIGYKFFNQPWPTENKWASKNRDMCIELLKVIKNVNINTNLDSSTPYRIYKLLKETVINK